MKTWVLFIISGLFFLFQVVLVRQYFFSTGWDVYTIYMASLREAKGTLESEFSENVVKDYFLLYPNNLFLVFIFSNLLKFAYCLGASDLGGYYALLVFQCFLSGLSGLLTYSCTLKITGDKGKSFLAYILYLLFVGLSPWVSIPYSDSVGLVFPLTVLWHYLVSEEKDNDRAKILCYFLIGFLTYAGYKIKPQIAIVSIAVVLISFLKTLDNKKRRTFFIQICCFIIGIFTSVICVDFACRSINLQTDKDQAVGVAHYVSMGMNQKSMGTFSEEDVDFARSFSTREERNAAEWKRAAERISESGGIKGALVQLVRKTLTTYSDGMFGWGQAGSFFRLIYDAPNETIAPKVRNLYYLDGSTYKYFSNYSQAMWLGILVLSVCSCFKKKKHYTISVVMLSLIGLFIFESLFEAGSRYLYIYLPFYIILASEGAMNLIHWICPSRMLSQKSILS